MTLPEPYYVDHACTIYHGDCREILPLLPKVDLLLTDPPYGVGLKAKQHKWFKREGVGYAGLTDDDYLIDSVVIPTVRESVMKFGRAVVTPGTRHICKYPQPDEVGAIYNRSGTGSGKWGFVCSTPVLFYGTDPFLADGKGRRPNSWEQPANDYAEHNGHPCPKPLGMVKWLVWRASREGETILDPFMGSGTTLRAAKDLGRRAIGIEINEEYCAIAVERLRQEVLGI